MSTSTSEGPGVATARATQEVRLRSNRVHPITRRNPGNNVGVFAPNIDYRFEPDADWIEMIAVHKGGAFGSDFRIGPLTGPDARVRVQVMHLAPGGSIGRHPTGVQQLFAVIIGTAVVSGADAVLRTKQAEYDSAVQNVRNMAADIDASNAASHCSSTVSRSGKASTTYAISTFTVNARRVRLGDPTTPARVSPLSKR